ncbi:MAG: SUMF1/EgtB/PvdO family nonheme iron enzyme [Anaerolineales bacterium]|jgi:iron(II)-dependent oxidoreductase
MSRRTAICFLLILVFFFTPACHPEDTHNNSGVENELVLIPAGWFLMGENDQRPSNNPQRLVYLNAFEIQTREVRRVDFAKFVRETGYQINTGEVNVLGQDGDLPMTNTLWKDADAYCRWLGMRLPTEAEWEKAARGEDGRHYPWGDQWDKSKANTRERNIEDVQPGGNFPQGQSPYGILDMCGNAAEWVADYYDRDYYEYAPDHNPTGPKKVMDHVLRGGSFDDPAEWATTYFRNSSHSAKPNRRAGFRCARSVLKPYP